MILAKEGVHPEVTTVAEQIKAAQQPEIDTMNRWLSAWVERWTPAAGTAAGTTAVRAAS